MLEIFLLVSMCKYVNRTATAKGYPGWAFAVLMVFCWFAFGVGGAILGAVGAASEGDGIGFGWVIGYFFGVAAACGLNALIVNLLAELPSAARAAEVEDKLSEQDYIAWRKRQLPKAKRVRAEEEEQAEVETVVVDLQPADATPPPRAQRVWKRKWGEGDE